jgi:hypothetical protein
MRVMKTVTCAILLVLAAATYLMARFEGARAVLIWPCLPGVMAGVFYSGHGNHPVGAWVVSYIVNSGIYVGIAFVLLAKRRAVPR